MNEFDGNLTKSLEDFMESYKMVTEFVPIFRVKQWLEYNNINNLQSKIDKAIEYIKTQQKILEGYDIVIENNLNNLLDILKENK